MRIIFLALALSSISAFAKTNPIDPIVRFPEWKNAWLTGFEPSNEQLRGKWAMVAKAGAKACREMIDDDFNWEGLNSERGTPTILSFAQVPATPERAPWFGVTLTDSLDRYGPIEYLEGAPQFFVEKNGFGKTTVGYSCHLISWQQKELLACALSIRLGQVLPGYRWAEESYACARTGLGLITLYKRK